MKKITLLASLTLFSFSIFAQTTLVNFDDVPAAFTYCFDSFSEADRECTAAVTTNPLVAAPNTSATVFQLTYSGNSANPSTPNQFDGSGVGLNSPSTFASNGKFFSMLFRSSTNTSGNVPVQLQIQKDGNNSIGAFTNYTKTDGSWEVLYFNFNEGTFETGTVLDTDEFTIVQIFPNNGIDASADTYEVDNIIQSANALSTNEFSKENGVSYFVRDNQLTINGAISGKEMRIFDVSGRTMLVAPIKGDINTFNISGLSSGVYVAVTDAGSFKFAK